MTQEPLARYRSEEYLQSVAAPNHSSNKFFHKDTKEVPRNSRQGNMPFPVKSCQKQSDQKLPIGNNNGHCFWKQRFKWMLQAEADFQAKHSCFQKYKQGISISAQYRSVSHSINYPESQHPTLGKAKFQDSSILPEKCFLFSQPVIREIPAQMTG